MEKDLHYYATAVLARAAGFRVEDALTIAYAAQYVDDATEHKPIQVGDILFDPTCTAHSGIRSFNYQTQKLVFIPFHFLPPKPILSHDSHFITEPDSPFAHQLIQEALNEKNYRLSLYRLGIALHTYADTFSHSGFSGRQHIENQVYGIHIHKESKWEKVFWKKILSHILPNIGHAEVSVLPDRPFLKWKYTSRIGNIVIEKDNTREFLKACQKMYHILLQAKKIQPEPIIPWPKIEEKIYNLLTFSRENMDYRCEKWRETFEYLFHPYEFYYDKHHWRKEALNTNDVGEVTWDDFDEKDYKTLQYQMKRDFYYSDWVYFHTAAAQQRNFVIEKMPGL